MSKSLYRIAPLLLGLLFISMFAINQLPPSASLGAAVNGTSVFTISLSVNPIDLIFGIFGTIGSFIALYGLMKDRNEDRKWKNVVIK